MKIKRQVNKQVLQNLLNTIKKARVSVGWTGDLAQIAYIQEYGANLKGGQPYMVDTDGYITFLKKTSKLGKKALKAGYSRGGGRNAKVRTKNELPEGYKVAALGVTRPSRLPARFLLLHTIEDHQGEWKSEATELGKRVATGKADWESAMMTLGEIIRGDIHKEIGEGQPPKNSTLTSMRKGGNFPPLETQKNLLAREIRVLKEVSK